MQVNFLVLNNAECRVCCVVLILAIHRDGGCGYNDDTVNIITIQKQFGILITFICRSRAHLYQHYKAIVKTWSRPACQLPHWKWSCFVGFSHQKFLKKTCENKMIKPELCAEKMCQKYFLLKRCCARDQPQGDLPIS